MVETDSESDPDKAPEVESMANLRVINKEFCRMLIYTEIFKSHADYLLLLKRCHEEYTTTILENRLLKKNQFHVLFDHLEALYENHGNLAKIMEAACNTHFSLTETVELLNALNKLTFLYANGLCGLGA